MSSKCVDACLCSHVPDTYSGITTTGGKDINGWVKIKGIDSTQMTMIMSDNLSDRILYKISILSWDIFTLNQRNILIIVS